MTINVARDFSRNPAGRYREDGPYSAEAFRENLLLPALLLTEETVTVELDGTVGYGCSFLEEAFGGLVDRLRARGGYVEGELKKRLVLVSDVEVIKFGIWRYIEHAEAKANEPASNTIACQCPRCGFWFWKELPDV